MQIWNLSIGRVDYKYCPDCAPLGYHFSVPPSIRHWLRPEGEQGQKENPGPFWLSVPYAPGQSGSKACNWAKRIQKHLGRAVSTTHSAQDTGASLLGRDNPQRKEEVCTAAGLDTRHGTAWDPRPGVSAASG